MLGAASDRYAAGDGNADRYGAIACSSVSRQAAAPARCHNRPKAKASSEEGPNIASSATERRPPKSAWPGVSTMLMRVSFHCTDAALARMVMPRSRSRSLELMARCNWAGCRGRRGLLQQDRPAWSCRGDVGDDGDVAKFHGSSSGRQCWKRDSRRKSRDQAFRITLQKPGIRKAPQRLKRKPGQTDRAHLTRCGAISSEIAGKQCVVCDLVS